MIENVVIKVTTIKRNKKEIFLHRQKRINIPETSTNEAHHVTYMQSDCMQACVAWV